MSAGGLEGGTEISGNFADLLKGNLTAGTRPGGNGDPWDEWDFRKAVKEAHEDQSAAIPSARTFRNWTNPAEGAPHPKTFDAICKVLFGTNPTQALAEAKQKLTCAWKAAKKKTADKPTATPAVPAPPPPPSQDTGPPIAARSRRMTNLRIVDMTIEKPPQNGTPASFDLLVDVRPGIEPFTDDPDYCFGIGKLTLKYQESGCQPTGKRLGEGATGPGVKSVSGAWELTAAAGEPLTEANRVVEVLATYEHQAEAEALPKVTLDVAGHTDDLRVVFRGDTVKLEGKAKAVLGQFLKHKFYPKKGAIDFGSASLTWKPGK